jgi:outer membrane protein
MTAMNPSNVGPAVVLALLLFVPVTTAGQVPVEVPLTLAEAEAGAVEGNPMLRAVRDEARAAGHSATAAGAFRWPGLQANAGVLGTDDPVAVFGSKLRQERFGAADLDVPLLNDPASVEDWTAGLGVRWEVASPARWAGLDASRADARAADAGALRMVQGTRYRARLFYLDLMRARGQTDAARAAEEAALATLDRVERRRAEGMATDAELLQARAAVSDARARYLQARSLAGDAADRLGAHLGWAPDRVPVPTSALADLLEGEGGPAWATRAGRGDGAAAGRALAGRADLVSSAASVEAARLRARQASASRLPSAAAFAQYATHAAGIGDERAAHWTAGVEITVPLFTGFGLRAAADAARAQARADEARHEARMREAQGEVGTALRTVESAHQARDAAVAAGEAAREAARLLRRRFEEGMTTLSELLRAESEAARLEAARVEADARLGMALATLDFALGATRADDIGEGEAR